MRCAVTDSVIHSAYRRLTESAMTLIVNGHRFEMDPVTAYLSTRATEHSTRILQKNDIFLWQFNTFPEHQNVSWVSHMHIISHVLISIALETKAVWMYSHTYILRTSDETSKLLIAITSCGHARQSFRIIRTISKYQVSQLPQQL